MTTLTATSERRPRALHVTLWIAQVILAGMFMMTGALKTFTPFDQLSLMMPWAKDSQVLIRLIGITQILGSLGLILPAALRISPRLIVWAAYGLTLTMVLATVFHLVRGEISATPVTVVLGSLAAFIAWGRSSRVPIRASGK